MGRPHPLSISTASHHVEQQQKPHFVRDYVLENDDHGMRTAMGRIAREEEAIRMHNEALQAIEDAALARALELSKETALEEARRRYCQPEAHIPDPSPSPPSRTKSKDRVKKQKDTSPIATSSREQAKSQSSPLHTPSRSEGRSPQEKPVVGATSASPEPRANIGKDGNEVDRSLWDDHSISHRLRAGVKFFVPPQNCHKCGKLVDRIHNKESVVGLHAVCTVCKITYCRGCFSPKGCPSHCSGGPACVVSENCCPGIRVITAFDVLADFNDAFVAALAEHQLMAGPHGCINAFMRAKDPVVRQFERSFINILSTLPQLLRTLSADLHPPIADLVFASYLPQVIYSYLKHDDVGDWVMHSEAYLAILEALKEFPDCGLGLVSSEPFVCHGTTGYPIPPNVNEGFEGGRWCCVKDAVNYLGAHQKRLTALSSRITFPATLLKVHRLSDGILYLLLQQVVN